MDDNFENPEDTGSSLEIVTKHINWAKEQDKDETLRFLRRVVISGRKPRSNEICSKFFATCRQQKF